MKTPQQWAEHLPEPIRTEFLENIDEGYSDKLDSLEKAIYKSFSWYKTPQGAQYWGDIYVRVYSGELDDFVPLPKQIPREIQLLRDVETEVNISGIISNHTYSEIVKLLKEID